MSLTVELSPAELRALAALAERAGRSPADYAHEALTAWLAEEAADVEWATKVKETWDSSDKVTRPLSDLRAELDL